MDNKDNIEQINNVDDMNQQPEFKMIRERMKERPVNSKKLLRRTVITAAMAVIFGVCACFTFLVLEPVFSNILTPEEEPEMIEIPLDEDEMLPTDMVEIEEEEVTVPAEEIVEEVSALENYSATYGEMYDLVTTSKKSVVTVSGVNQDVDWFNNSYESKDISTGLIVANNGKELLILSRKDAIENYESIDVVFFNETEANGYIKQTDKNTGLAIVAVPITDVSETLLDKSVIAKLGNSKPSRLLASPVIAIGRPLGTATESIEYGMITSKDNMVSMEDSNYEVLFTDMYGNDMSNGVLINLDGEVVGVIDQEHNSYDKTILSAIGISDIKKTIERMSNAKTKAVFGIYGEDVSMQAQENGVPAGAYVKGLVMDSPAMMVGVQSGDVIVSINGNDIVNYRDFTEMLSRMNPGGQCRITINRPDGEQYTEMKTELTLGSEEQ